MISIMSSVNDIMTENCRTCLSYFNESNRKYSLANCLPLSSDSGRFQLMKTVMTTCSLTLFTNEEDEEITETFICMSCVLEMNQMLNFLQKCINSEAILKQAAEVKIERISVEDFQKENESSVEPKVEIKVESLSQVENSCNGFEDDSFREVDDPSPKNNNSKLECQECHKTFPSVLSLTFHRYKHPGYRPHTCVICHESFRTLQLIKKHMAVEHDNKYFQQCRQCSEVFTSKQHLILHEQKVHSAKKYPCPACRRTFSTISSLKFHENIHTGQQPYSCALCCISFTSASMLRNHRSIAHSEQFKCHCGRSFNRKRKLELHIEAVHEKNDKSRKYTCPECDKNFHHPCSLKNHLNTHLGFKPFPCSACESAFTTLSNLRSHFRRIHSGTKLPAVKKYLCHACGDSFARASHLQRHTLRKHEPNVEKKHECPVCKKKFLEKSDVTGHLKLHNDEKPFECDQCSKCFRTAWRLQAHVNRVHLGLRPFECPTCSVKFKTKSHLEKHIRTHTGEKPFPCPHCAYTCAEKSNLKKHINIHLKSVHNIRL